MNLAYAGNPVQTPRLPPVISSTKNLSLPTTVAPQTTTKNMGMFMRVVPPPAGTGCGCGGGH
jgi:hypothetical protein